MANFVGVGYDIGSQKTIIVAEDGEIIRTSTGKLTYCSASETYEQVY